MIFGKDNSEVIIKKDGIKHIADILTKNEVVIELQNSPIQKPIVRRREQFYGEKMLWVINGERFKSNFNIHKPYDRQVVRAYVKL
jgi:competence CoiA-like predicted nuclease